jgi:hypothetical protein
LLPCTSILQPELINLYQTSSGHKGNANQNHTKIPPHPC